jgi:hypothetical protein
VKNVKGSVAVIVVVKARGREKLVVIAVLVTAVGPIVAVVATATTPNGGQAHRGDETRNQTKTYESIRAGASPCC